MPSTFFKINIYCILDYKKKPEEIGVSGGGGI